MNKQTKTQNCLKSWHKDKILQSVRVWNFILFILINEERKREDNYKQYSILLPSCDKIIYRPDTRFAIYTVPAVKQNYKIHF